MNPTIQTAFAQGVSPLPGYVDKNNMGTLTIKVPGVSGVVKFGDWRWMRIFNRVCWIEGAQDELLFFASGKGVTLQGGNRRTTRIDTNQPRQGDSGLPTDWGAYVYSPRLSVCYVSGTDPTDIGGQGDSPTDLNPDSLDSAEPNARVLFEVERKVLFTFSSNDKDRQAGHFIDYPRGGGITAMQTQIGFDQAINGLPSPQHAHQLVVPIQLDANQQFQMTATAVATLALDQAQQVNDRENTSIVMQCDIEGLYKVKVN